MTRILIGALSGWKMHERRQRCIETWMGDATDLEIETMFLLGCAPAAVPEELGWHYLALPCPDDYASLPQRTLWFCRWALEEGGKGEGGRRMGLSLQVRRRHLRQHPAFAVVRTCAAGTTWGPSGGRAWAMAAAGPAISSAAGRRQWSPSA